MYTIFTEDIEDPSILTAIEEWVDEESLNQHYKSTRSRMVPELKNFEKYRN